MFVPRKGPGHGVCYSSIIIHLRCIATVVLTAIGSHESKCTAC